MTKLRKNSITRYISKDTPNYETVYFMIGYSNGEESRKQQIFTSHHQSSVNSFVHILEMVSKLRYLTAVPESTLKI